MSWFSRALSRETADVTQWAWTHKLFHQIAKYKYCNEADTKVNVVSFLSIKLQAAAELLLMT